MRRLPNFSLPDMTGLGAKLRRPPSGNLFAVILLSAVFSHGDY